MSRESQDRKPEVGNQGSENVGQAIGAETELEAPVVFISYSHDTPAHKKWVGELATRLVGKGVDVILDQWDLGLGDDVPKFMERAVGKADRVLMICTEAYVRKADDGKGGVGYEAMIVTGELVKGLGTAKFIPIVRQPGEPKTRPRCVGTRLYVDLSDGANFEENFDLLLREIHDAPKLPKPPLGQNPFSTGGLEGPAKKALKEERRVEFASSLGSTEAGYERAMAIVRGDDRVAWRKLLMAASENGAAALKRWKADQTDIPPVKGEDWSARYAHALAGVDAYAPLIACIVAAAETGKAGYANQLGWVDSVLEPADYGESRNTYFAAFPQTVFFVMQALVGGMLMLSGSGEAVHQLATVKLTNRFGSSSSGPLFSMTGFNGWPESLEHSCTIARGFLGTVISKWGWLKLAFGNEVECRAGIAGYYQLLSFLNFVALAKSGRLEKPQDRDPITVPLNFSVWPRESGDKGYMLFLKMDGVLRRIMESNNLDHAALEAAWPKWLAMVGQWLASVCSRYWPSLHGPQSAFPQDLKKDPYAVG
jgi:TIR domain